MSRFIFIIEVQMYPIFGVECMFSELTLIKLFNLIFSCFVPVFVLLLLNIFIFDEMTSKALYGWVHNIAYCNYDPLSMEQSKSL